MYGFLLILGATVCVTNAEKNNDVYQRLEISNILFQRLDNITIFQDLLSTKLAERLDIRTLFKPTHSGVKLDNVFRNGVLENENGKKFFTVDFEESVFEPGKTKKQRTTYRKKRAGRMARPTDNITSQISDIREIYHENEATCSVIGKYSDASFLVIDSCPELQRYTRLGQLCHRYDEAKPPDTDFEIDVLDIPVEDSRGVVYRNVYCAFCHGKNNTRDWITHVECDELAPIQVRDADFRITLLENLKSEGSCVTRMQPINERSLVGCNITHQGPRRPQLRSGAKHLGISTQGGNLFPLSFSILMNFGFDGRGHILFSTAPVEPVITKECRADQIYDPYSDICRQILCSGGYHLINGKCQQLPMIDNSGDSSDADLRYLKYVDKPAYVTLYMNMTELYMFVFAGDAKIITQLIKSAICHNLNITCERLQNFTYKLTNYTGDKGTYDIQPAPTKHEKPTVLMGPTESSVRKSAYSMKSDLINASQNVVKDGVLLLNVTASPSRNYSEPDPEPKVYTLEVRFLLLPPAGDDALGTSVDILVQQIMTQIQTNSFTITINGTDIEVGDYDEHVKVGYWCEKGERRLYIDRDFDVVTKYDPVTGKNVSHIVVNKTNESYAPGEFDLTVLFGGIIGNGTAVSSSGYVYVCAMPHIEQRSCRMIQIGESEYYRVLINNSLIISGQEYNTTEYEYAADGKTVSVCLSMYLMAAGFGNNKTEFTSACHFPDLIKAESYLSFGLGILSIVALTTVLLTYSLFGKLRNLPGINTINLTVALLVGELVFLLSGPIGLAGDWLCTLAGCVLHYFFLASFFWMNVMAYDVYRTFGNACILTRIREKSKYGPRYGAYAWGTPAVIVGICAFIDFSGMFDTIRIGYGSGSIGTTDSSLLSNTLPPGNISLNMSEAAISNTMLFRSQQSLGCWIQEPVATMIAFGAPLVLVLSSNIVMFGRTIISIREICRATNIKTRRISLSHMTGKHDVMLYIRMSTVMGFTWLVGLASSMVSAFTEASYDVCAILHALGIIFVVLNCSQGLFIFFAFTFNKRVLALYRQKVKRASNCVARPLSNQSSTAVSIISEQSLKQTF